MSHVRFAQVADIPALVELGRQMHVQSRYAWLVFSASQLWQYLEQAMARKQFCVIVGLESAQPNAQITGGLLAHADSYPFSTEIVAALQYLYVVPQKRGSPLAMKMLIPFKKWAANREAAEITVINQFGVNQVQSAKLLAKLGMPLVGGQHSMWLERK